MYLQITGLATFVALASTATASSMFVKRDSWGPSVGMGPSTQQIVSTTTTVYPGEMPPDQAGYLFVWMGISNGTGDLIQSVLGSYPKGLSECSGPDADTTWCVSSEVFGNDAEGEPNQWVGSLTTADTNYTNGITFSYTLTDKTAYTWVQTMTDAKTGTLLSTFTKNSGPMLGWGTANECDDYNGVACTGTIATQTWVNTTITLEAADSAFSDTVGASLGATYTDMESSDGGQTWTIAEIVIPPMESAASTASSATSSVGTLTTFSTSASATTNVAKADPTTTTATAAISSFISSSSNSTAPFSSSTGPAKSHHRGDSRHGFKH